MKPIFTTLLLSTVLLLSSFNTQNSTIDEVIGALRSGNSTELSKYFDDNVELTLPEKSDKLQQSTGATDSEGFFNNNNVKGFDLKHKGDSPGGHFCIGTLQTNAGNFRTNVFMKSRNGKEVIKEIRFQSIE